MTSITWKAVRARLASTQWLILIAIIATAYGWFGFEHTVVWERSFYLKTLALPLVLALVVGAFPGAAPYNPDDSEDYWKVASITFKLFFIVLALVLVLFRLNSL